MTLSWHLIRISHHHGNCFCSGRFPFFLFVSCSVSACHLLSELFCLVPLSICAGIRTLLLSELFLLIAENFHCNCSYSKWRFHLLCLHHLYCICIVGCFFCELLQNVCICYYLNIVFFFCHFLIYAVFHFHQGRVIFLFTSVLTWRGGLWFLCSLLLGSVISTLGLSWQWISSLGRHIDSLTLWSNEISLLVWDCITCLPVTVFKILMSQDIY